MIRRKHNGQAVAAQSCLKFGGRCLADNCVYWLPFRTVAPEKIGPGFLQDANCELEMSPKG